MPLTTEQIQALLAKEQKRASSSKTPQVGPLRYHDATMRCAKRGCMVDTHYKVQGVPYCTIHSLEELNMMLVSQGFKGVVGSFSLDHNPTILPVGRVCSATVRAKADVGWSLGNDTMVCIHYNKLDKDCIDCSNGYS